MAGSSAGSIYVDLLLRDAKYVQGLKNARSETSALASSVTSSLKGVAASFGVAFSVNEIVKYSDAWKQLEGRLSLVTDSTDELTAIQDKLFNISQDTRTDLQASVTLYQRVTSATKDLGISQSDVLKFVEQLNKQLIVSGASSTEASSAILQLTQAFNKGKLDGDEFRSVLENAPSVLEALTKSLGKSKNEIYELSKAGKLAPQQLIDAVNSMSDITDKRFSEFKLTIGQAFTELNNSILRYIGNSQSFNDATNSMASSVKSLSGFIDDLSSDTNVARTTMYGLFSLIIDFYKEYQELSLSVQESTNFLGLRDDEIKETETNINNATAALQRMGDELLMLNERDKWAITIDPTLVELTKDKTKPKTGTADPEKLASQAKELQSIYDKNRELLTGLSSAQLQYNDRIKDFERLLSSGKISQDEFNDAVARADVEFDKSSKKAQVWAFDVEAAAKRASENIQDSFADFLFDPFEKGLGGMLDGFATTLRRMAAEAASAQILGGLFGQQGISGSSSVVGSFFSSIFGGARASGGAVNANKTYLVGENGPELFTTRNSGTIIPNSQLGGSGGVSVNIINNASNNSVTTKPGSDGASLDVMIDEVVAQKISTPGSRTNQAMGNFNNRTLTRR